MKIIFFQFFETPSFFERYTIIERQQPIYEKLNHHYHLSGTRGGVGDCVAPVRRGSGLCEASASIVGVELAHSATLASAR